MTDEPTDHLLTIGALARRSGLTASALRFYDREGVLAPAEVDPATGYRRYAPEQVRAARLIAGLRRVGMPLGEVNLVLEQFERGEVAAAGDIVTAHEGRLEAGLRDARREIRRTLALLDTGSAESSVTVVVAAEALAGALESVRFAAAVAGPGAVGQTEGEVLPVLTGILLEVDTVRQGLRLVATDRYRLALGHAPGRGAGLGTCGRGSGVVPPGWLHEVCTASVGDVSITLLQDRVVAEAAGHRFETPCVPGEFPDYRRVLDPDTVAPAEALPAGPDLLHALRGAGTGPVRLSVDGGRVRLTTGEEPADVLVNGEFLLEALAAVEGPATLVLDGPVTPLAIRGTHGGLSVLMPVRAEAGDPS